MELSTNVSIDELRLLIENLLNKIQHGISISDIENALFLIVFIRFIILAIRYNIRTSFYITAIGIFASYLWYRHLLDIISVYSNIIIEVPFFQNLGNDGIQLQSLGIEAAENQLKMRENVQWYNPGQLFYYGIVNGIRTFNPDTDQNYYIDPISMIIAKLQYSIDSNIVSFYYNLYKTIIPNIFRICSQYWSQISGIAAYAVITRIGKKYCPYLIRWHWTLILIIGMIEQFFMQFIMRLQYFQTQILMPKLTIMEFDGNLKFQIASSNFILIFLISLHIGLLIFGLFHAIWGQYFYFPFFVENVELHIGRRPKNSIYSGGYTSWQDPEKSEKNLNSLFPKIWYGWFGNSDKKSLNIFSQIRKFIQKLAKKFI